MADPVLQWNGRPGPDPVCAAIVPSRGRPGQLAGLIGDFGRTAACTELVICLDADDPALPGYKDLMAGPVSARARVSWYVGERRGLAGWTNELAADLADGTLMLFSLGDDHRSVTERWDRKFLAAAQAMGGGWVYGDDGVTHQHTPDGWVTSQLPSAFGVSSEIVHALGWMMLPGCAHMAVDAAVRDLGLAAGRLAWLPQVKIPHLHYSAGLSPYDQTYADGRASTAADDAVYRAWLGDPPGTGQIRDDAETVRRALG